MPDLDPEALENAAEAAWNAKFDGPNTSEFEESWADIVGGMPIGADRFRSRIQTAIASYLSFLEAKGLRMMPREPTDEMIMSGIAERHDQRVPEAWSLATANIWRAMFNTAANEPAKTVGSLQCRVCSRLQEFSALDDVRIQGWQFASDTGWRCPAHTNTPHSEPRQPAGESQPQTNEHRDKKPEN